MKTVSNVLIILIIMISGLSSVKAVNNNFSIEDIIIEEQSDTINVNKNKFNNIINEELGITKENIQNIYFVKEEDLPDNIEGSIWYIDTWWQKNNGILC